MPIEPRQGLPIVTAIVMAIVMALILALALLCIAADSWADDPAELEARLEQLRSEIAGIQQRIDRDLAARDSLMDALATAERRISSARRAVSETAGRLGVSRSEIASLDSRREDLEEEAAGQAGALGQQLALAYRHGSTSRLKMLLNQDDPRSLSRRLAYHGYLTRARLNAIDQLSATLDQLADTRRRLEAERQTLEELLARRESELRELEQARDERTQALSALDARIRNDREQLAELERDAEELTRLLEELATALADVPPDIEIEAFPELRGKLPYPVNGPVARSFGQARGGDLQWNGWMIRADEGEPVQAVAHGRVAYADWLRGYGLIMILDHGDGFMTLYAHNESLMRDVGDWVGPEEIIATVGNSGGSDEAGMYFELRRDGQPLNPAGWFRARDGR